MRRFKPLIVAVFAVFALGAVVAASAFAARGEKTPEINPIGSFTDATATGTTPKFIGKGLLGTSEIECFKGAESTGGFQTSLLGTFDILFKECLVDEPIVGLLLCTGSNDTANSSSILVLGTFHLRYLSSAKTKAALLYLVIPVKFTCVKESTTAEIEVKGCAGGEIGPINTVITLPRFFQNTLKKVSGTTRNEITKFENEAGTGEESCELEANENKGTFTESAEEATGNIYPTSATSEIIT